MRGRFEYSQERGTCVGRAAENGKVERGAQKYDAAEDRVRVSAQLSAARASAAHVSIPSHACTDHLLLAKRKAGTHSIFSACALSSGFSNILSSRATTCARTSELCMCNEQFAAVWDQQHLPCPHQ
eukprot:1557604-Rhodomonas_salina.2